jgi:hypothetical protein
VRRETWGMKDDGSSGSDRARLAREAFVGVILCFI